MRRNKGFLCLFFCVAQTATRTNSKEKCLFSPPTISVPTFFFFHQIQAKLFWLHYKLWLAFKIFSLPPQREFFLFYFFYNRTNICKAEMSSLAEAKQHVCSTENNEHGASPFIWNLFFPQCFITARNHRINKMFSENVWS